MIEPVGYLEMVYMLKQCQIVLTDSGGLQKEAFFFKKPCITMRDETEWVELVEIGWNKIWPPGIFPLEINSMLEAHINQKPTLSLYGDGKAASKIVKELLK